MGDRAVVVPLDADAAAVEAIVALHRRTPLDAVLAVDDQGVVVAQPWPRGWVRATTRPARSPAPGTRRSCGERLTAARSPSPPTEPLLPDADVASAAAEVGYPCVVKPVSRSASQGVIRVDDHTQADAAAARLRAIMRRRDPEPLLVEPSYPGPRWRSRVSSEGASLEVLAVFDKPDPLDGPYFEETIYVTPSAQPHAIRAAIEATRGQAAAALGLGKVRCTCRAAHQRDRRRRPCSSWPPAPSAACAPGPCGSGRGSASKRSSSVTRSVWRSTVSPGSPGRRAS